MKELHSKQIEQTMELLQPFYATSSGDINPQRNRSDQPNNKGFFEKIFDDTISKIVGTLITLLVAACGFLVFQYQLEYQKIQQERFELDNKFADISIVWDMGDIYTNGWFYTEKEARFEKMNYIVALLPERIYEDSLGLSREYVEWSVKSVSQLSREKAQIEGYVIDKDLADGIPLGFQKDYIDLYNYQIMQLNNITDLSLQWHNLTIDERAAGNIKNYELSTELVGIYDRMFAKHDQFVKIGVEEGERYNKQKEILDLTEENLKKTNVLAKIGLVSGGALFFGMVFYKLFWRSREHTNTSTNRSRRRR